MLRDRSGESDAMNPKPSQQKAAKKNLGLLISMEIMREVRVFRDGGPKEDLEVRSLRGVSGCCSMS